MLQPEYSRRPQAAGEILTLLQSEPASNGQEGISNSEQTVSDATRSNQRYLWIGIMTGIVALVTFGLWFDKKPAETVDGKQSTVATQPLFQRNPGKTTVTPEIKEEQSIVSSVVAQSNPESESESESDSDKLSEPEKLPELADETTPLKTNIDEVLIQKHLVAAEKAYKAGHFTTPSRDNAYKYYQMVLATEPNNAEARAGLQKIVGRYVQFIEKAKIEGKLNMVRLYLQRAELVLPDDPKLQNIRKELAAQ
jgi:hypothetical protein